MTELPILDRGPEKAKFGEPCSQCGVCCAAEVCEVGRVLHGDVPAPCPSLAFDSGRFWCGAVRLADDMSPMHGAMLRLRLGVGVGCDSQDHPDVSVSR